MRDVLLIFLILISLSIIALVLSQQKSGGLGSAFGGGGGGGGEAYRSKRGVEKLFHYLTILLAVLFSTVSLSLIFIN